MAYSRRRDGRKMRGRAAWHGIRVTLGLGLGLLLVLPGVLGAGVFRCTDADGGVLFQQTPCAQGEEIELDVRTTEWVESPPGKSPGRKKSSPRSQAGEQAALSRATQAERKQAQACWRAKQRIERIETELRHGYKPARGERLRRQRRQQSDYLRAFCR